MKKKIVERSHRVPEGKRSGDRKPPIGVVNDL